MLYEFSPLIQQGIAAGKYLPVFSKGIPIGMARDTASGQFVSHAIGVASDGVGLNPLTGAPQLLMGMNQGQMALQSLKALSASISTLQATTAVIGVGTAVTAALTAVNLWQTLKLRQDVKQMRLEIKEGFIDLKAALADQGAEIIQHIQAVADDVEYRNHRTILARAYGLFQKALVRLEAAIALQDPHLRNDEITATRGMLFQALADYDNDQLLNDVCAAAYLRRRECVWAIEQAIVITYQLQSELGAVSDRLTHLEQMVRSNAVAVLKRCEEIEELDFLFPEFLRIHNHDLATLEAWRIRSDWQQSLPPSDLKLLNEALVSDAPVAEVEVIDESLAHSPTEYQIYEEAQQQSRPDALWYSLLLLMDTQKRESRQHRIGESARQEGWNAINSQNLQKASPWSIANLDMYFHAESLDFESEVEVSV